MELGEVLDRGEVALAEAVSQKLPESLTLDFKGSEGMFSGGTLTKEGRRVLAKALSAFSNSAGGLLILGVDAREVDGVDAAHSLAPIADIERVFSSINAQVGELIRPAHGGLTVHRINTTDRKTKVTS